MGSVILAASLAAILGLQSADAQDIQSNTLGDFVKGLTSLISANGGLGSLVNALPRPPLGGYPVDSPDPGYAPGYPEGTYDRPPPPGHYRPVYRPDYRPPPGYYRPPPGYYGPPGPPALPPGLDYPPGQGYYPPNGFMAALTSIARHDDLRCVPRLLCEVTSGGKPGYPSYLGQQNTRDTITNLLTALNFMDDNPLFIFGRAALLGASSRGNSAACLNAYPTCPRDPDKLVHYLNNHNGGFFRFFGGLPDHQQRGQGEAEVVEPAEGEGRIQNRPSYQVPPAVRPPSREPQSFKFADDPRPAEPQDYLPVSAHGSEGKLVFPEDRDRGGRTLSFPREEAGSGPYKPDFSPPQNLVNFRDQRSVKFPDTKMAFPKTR